jgi:hypothetical protein
VASQYADRFLAPLKVTNLDYPWDTQLVSFPEAISGTVLDSAWSAADSLRISRAVDQLHDSAREARRVRKLIADDRSDRLLLPIERLNVGYCRALIDAVEDNHDPHKMRAALAQVRTRYW